MAPENDLSIYFENQGLAHPLESLNQDQSQNAILSLRDNAYIYSRRVVGVVVITKAGRHHKM